MQDMVAPESTKQFMTRSNQVCGDNPPNGGTYELSSVRLPRLSGARLSVLLSILESPARRLLLPKLFRIAGVMAFRARYIQEAPTFQPAYHPQEVAENSLTPAEWPHEMAKIGRGFRFPTVHDYATAYRNGTISPEQVAANVVRAIESSHRAAPPLGAVIAMSSADVLRQGRESATRIRGGRALSVWDGVPVAVKDELDMVPYPTTVGTSFLGGAPATVDATVVARLRAAGALLIGKTNMHEIGIGVTGLNLRQGTPRNPYAPAHYTGGSSSGSAAAVAAGLCPMAVGADGGGSIRIPSAFCGLVGLKPTYGRVSEFGAAPLCWSVAHVGPMAATATDAALGYAAMAGADVRDPNSLRQPRPTLEGWDNLDLRDLRLGVFRPWFQHAAPEVVGCCESLLRQLQHMGAQVREIVIPDLELARVAHAITICSEMAEALKHEYREHRSDFNPDVRLNLVLAYTFGATDYVQAQRVRTRMMSHFERAFAEVDAVITPTTGVTAPEIHPHALRHGESDLAILTEIMRFATVANLTGLPAISFPAGYDSAGLPVGMQAIGRPFDERTLLRLALASEQVVERRRPQIFFPILN